MTEIIGTIANSPLFNGLSDLQLRDIQEIAIPRRYGKGETIFSEGDAGDGFYIVIEGKIKICKIAADGKEQILHIFGPGEPFGEVPVFSGRPFPATAQTLSKANLLFLPRTAFVELISGNPSLALSMLAVLSKRLRQFTVQIENLSLKEVPARLASYLLYLAREQETPGEVTLEISKGQLASLLGTIPETLSRIFARMSSMQLIEVNNRQIRLINIPGLEELAENG